MAHLVNVTSDTLYTMWSTVILGNTLHLARCMVVGGVQCADDDGDDQKEACSTSYGASDAPFCTVKGIPVFPRDIHPLDTLNTKSSPGRVSRTHLYFPTCHLPTGHDGSVSFDPTFNFFKAYNNSHSTTPPVALRHSFYTVHMPSLQSDSGALNENS